MPTQDPTTVKLLTLLNVSSLRSTRRSLKASNALGEGQTGEAPKRRKLGGKLFVEAQKGAEIEQGDVSDVESEDEVGEDDTIPSTSAVEAHSLHFGTSQESAPAILTPASRSALDANKLVSQRLDLGAGPDELGSVVSLKQEGETQEATATNLPSLLSTYRDIMLPYVGTSPKHHDNDRRKVCDHIVQHLQTHRKRIMNNNARLLAHSKAAAAATQAAKSNPSEASKTVIPDPPADVRDQGFTRPTVLILLPFRNSALALVDTLIASLHDSNSPKPGETTTPKTENYARLQSEYGLPPGAEDKLLSAEPGTYPPDHVRTFAGNTDDAFRLGLRLSNKGKGWRLFSGFLGSDIVIASPLGLRMGIERDGPPDFLSSLEIVLVDQLDSLAMQNWTHLTHVLELCNVLPREAHGADFARVREWCLDGHSAYLRQTVLLSSYETPQIRALFNNTKLLRNVAGRVRQARRYGAAPIPEGIVTNWAKIECEEAAKEADARFEYFKTKLLPDILSTAQAQTLIFVPSYFDYLRVYNHLLATAPSNVTGISEYSTNQDISRARQAFFKGSKPVLVITERFYFFRRYKLRAVKHITFYAPPDHAQFFTEILSFPFLDEETAPDPADVKITCLYSKFDYMRLERVEGTTEAATMCAPTT